MAGMRTQRAGARTRFRRLGSSARATGERFVADIRPYAVIGAIFGVYLILRAWAYATVDPGIAIDSGMYILLAEEGHIGFDEGRPFFLPLFYAILGSNEGRVAGQALLSTVSWGVFAWVVSREMRTRVMQNVALAAILALALTPQVLQWDGAMLSESLSTSLGMLILSCAVVMVRRGPSTPLLVGFTLLSIAFVFTRDSNGPTLVLLLLPVAAVVALRGARLRGAVLAAVVLGLFVVSSISVDQGDRDRFTNLNIVGQRILPNPEMRDWFAARGMPVTPDVLARSGTFAGDDEYAFYEIKPLIDWVENDMRRHYVRYLLTHPRYLIQGPWQNREEQFVPIVGGSLPKTNFQAALPYWISDFAYPAELTEIFFWTVAVVAFTIVVALRHGWDRRWILPLILLATAPPHALMVYHADAMELGRHSVTMTLLLRVALLWLLLVAVDRLIATRRGGRSSLSSRAAAP